LFIKCKYSYLGLFLDQEVFNLLWCSRMWKFSLVFLSAIVVIGVYGTIEGRDGGGGVREGVSWGSQGVLG
jgi:hypothetical protein